MNASFCLRCVRIGAGLLLLTGGVVLGLLGFMAYHAHPSPSPHSIPTVSDRAFDYLIDSKGFPHVDWEYWLNINPDIIGWITVPNTPINYPIVQARPDAPNYYLHHDVYRHYNFYGVPYLDSACADGGLLSSPHALVFGHHINDGSQFSSFAACSNKAYAQAHKTILLQTPDGAKSTYSIRCVRIISGTSEKRTRFLKRDDYLDWYATQIDTACVVLDATTQPDNVITFVTCSYHYSNDERTLVLASKITP